MLPTTLDRIIAGDFPPGPSVPGELELSAKHEVSRMTVREAMKTLEAQRILSVERGRGTFVNPLNRWASLEAVLRAASEGRTKLRPPCNSLSSEGCWKPEPANWPPPGSATGHQALSAMLRPCGWLMKSTIVAAFVEADLAFHDLILRASENVFVAVLFEPLQRVLKNAGAETSAVRTIQVHAIGHHQLIAEAWNPAIPPGPGNHGLPHAANSGRPQDLVLEAP